MSTYLRSQRILSGIASATLCLSVGGLISLWLGQDANWDLQNYHFYDAWAYHHDRLRQDLFAAGIQTYFPPLLDLPYYALSTHFLAPSPRVLAFLMGLPFGILLFFSFQIAWVVSAQFIIHRHARILLCLGATAFGCSGVAVVEQIGTTFNEVQLAALVMGGLWLLLLCSRSPLLWNSRAGWLIFTAGLFLGSAAALKFTAVVYAPGAGLICLLLPGSIGRRLTRAALFSAAWTAMVLVLWLPWGMSLDHLTGNPLFPMFNNLFHSNWVPAVGGQDLRYRPTSFLPSVFYPFYWVTPNYHGSELPFADARYALAYIAVVTVLIVGVVRLIRKAPETTSGTPAGSATDYSAVGLIVYVIVTYIVWQSLFSILRYTAALESVTGAMVLVACGTLYRLSPWPKTARYALVSTVCLLSVVVMSATVCPSYGRVPYRKTVWTVETPRLKPGATVVLTDQPLAYVAPFLARSAPNVSFIGLPGYITGPSNAGFQLMRQMRTRIAGASSLYIVDHQGNVPAVARLADAGLAADYQSCGQITSNIGPSLNICAAHHIAPTRLSEPPQFSLAPMAVLQSPDLTVSIVSANTCAADATQQALTIHYAARAPIGQISIYVQNRPSPPVLMTTGPAASTFKTGPWITGGWDVLFIDATGRTLADYALHFVPCPPGSSAVSQS